MADWFELSSTDMVHWTKTASTLTTDVTNTTADTAILSLKAFSWANANAWAGQLVTANGKFYWYVPVQQASDGSMAIGVAVADSPTGPFKDALGHALINDAFEMSNEGYATPSATPYTIDPTVFVDDNGTAYMHYGGFGRMNEAQLGQDMISIVGKMKEDSPQGYFEAAYLTKRVGITQGPYYEIYAAGQNPATIDYATSTSPMGPWTYKGRVLDQMPQAAGQTDAPTNHSGVAEFQGQWYIVYHVSNGPMGGGTYRREVQIDKMNFNPDGTIQKVTPSGGLRF
jgi:beta-xylosidase